MAVPRSYVAALGGLVILAIVTLLAYRGVPPFDSVGVFVVTNLFAVLLLMVFGVIGGAFVGMLLAHRMLSSREFSPFERTVITGIEELREGQRRLEDRLTAAEKLLGRRD